MIVCLVAILAAPAMAAGPSHGIMTPHFARRIGTAGTPGHGVNVLSSLEAMAFPVAGPLAAVMEAKNIIQRFIRPSSAGFSGTFPGNLRPGLNRGAFNRTAHPLYPAPGGAQGTAAIGYEENFTAYLAGKGYDVSDLSAAISDANTAIAGSNLTALRGAMMTFQRDLNAKVMAGTINRTVIQDFAKTMTPGARGTGVWRGPTGMPGMMRAHPMGTSWRPTRAGWFYGSSYSHPVR